MSQAAIYHLLKVTEIQFFCDIFWSIVLAFAFVRATLRKHGVLAHSYDSTGISIFSKKLFIHWRFVFSRATVTQTTVVIFPLSLNMLQLLVGKKKEKRKANYFFLCREKCVLKACFNLKKSAFG